MLFTLVSQSPRRFCTQVCLHSTFLLLWYVPLLQVPRTPQCQADFATGLGRIRMSELQHNARDVSHHLASLTSHVRASLPVPKTYNSCHPKTTLKLKQIPLQVIYDLAKGLGLSHFCDHKNQRLWLLLQHALPWAYIHSLNAPVKASVLFEHICIFISMWFTNTIDTLLERHPHPEKCTLQKWELMQFTALQ